MSGKKKIEIILIGGGGHCKSVIDVITGNDIFQIIGILDLREKVGSELLGFPIIGTDEDLPQLMKRYSNFHISLGHILSNTSRIKLFNSIKELGGNLPVISANDAHISVYATIGEGVFIGHKVVINAGAHIGINTIINTGAIIEHDTVIGKHCHISTLAAVNADCIIRDSCFLSSQVVVNRGIELADKAVVYSGSVITKSFKKKGISLKGIPAKIII